jgi:hypothetical protein
VNPLRLLPLSRRIADVLLGLALALVVIPACFPWLLYNSRFSHYEDAAAFLMIAILLRLALALDWETVRTWRWSSWVRIAILAPMAYYAVPKFATGNVRDAVWDNTLTRVSYEGVSDREFKLDTTGRQKFYPQHAFVERVQKAIPIDARIAYFGDLRGHLINTELYPRKLYQLPELQIQLNSAVQTNWEWIGVDDPFHPIDDFLSKDPNVHLPDPAVQQAFREMLARHQIEWVIYYDSVWPERSWFRRL